MYVISILGQSGFVVVVQVALNTGHHQLPLYASGPNGVDPLTPTTMKDAGSRRVPCASLLVRLYQAPVGRNGQPLEVRVLPQNCPLLQRKHKRKLCRVLHNNCVIVFRRKSQLCNIAAIPAQTHGNKNYAPCACVLCADVVNVADVALTCVDSRSTSHNTTGCASVCGALCRATRTVFITLWTVGRHQVCASSKGCFFKRICTKSRILWCL